MQKHRSLFVKGSTNKGVQLDVAEKLFDQMVLFAEYCFNKSHSTAYGAVTYQTAYLKAHYPVAYMAALLTVNSGATEKIQRYISNCNSMGIEVMPPDINASGMDFTPDGNRLLFGLSARSDSRIELRPQKYRHSARNFDTNPMAQGRPGEDQGL